MASSGGLKSAELFQGRDAILSGPAGGVVGMAETAQARRLRQGDRLRHGRHVDRRVALRRRVRALVRDGGGRRAHARADAAHPHGGGGRRLDPVLRRHALPRRPAVGGCRPGPQVLSPRRAADRHRRQRHGRQAARRDLPENLRAGPRPAARRGCGALGLRGAGARDRRRAHAGGGGRRLHPHRGREHGQCHQEDLGAARLRRHRVCAQLLRLGRRPARLRHRRHAGHGDRADPPAVGAAVRLRHGAGADPGEPRAVGGGGAGRRRARCLGWIARAAGGSDARRGRRAGRRGGRYRRHGMGAPALRGHRHGAARSAGGRKGHARHLRDLAPPALRLRVAGEAGGDRGAGGGGGGWRCDDFPLCPSP